MKHPNRIAAALCLMLGLAGGYAAGQEPDNPETEKPKMLAKTKQLIAEKKPVRVVLYGDSISEVGRSPNWNGGAKTPDANWGAVLVKRLNEAYPGSKFSVHHFAIGGQNTYEGLGRLDWLEPLKPDLVLVAFGANDCGYHFLIPEETKLALTSLAKGIMERYGADVVVCSTAGDNPLKPFFKHLDETLKVQREAAQECGVPFVDMRSAILAATENGKRWTEFHFDEGNCHPTDPGQAVWAEAAFKTIQESMK